MSYATISGANTPTVSAIRGESVTARINRGVDALQGLHEKIATLERNLDCLLSPVVPKPPAVDSNLRSVEGDPCTLAANLRLNAEGIESAAQRVSDIINRLGLE